jgi:hypothetical protein
MADEQGFASVESLRPVFRAAFGADRRLLGVDRLAGGSKKGVYRLTMDDGATVLAYAWNDAEDYWRGVLPEDADDPADPFLHASGLTMLETAASRLASVGVRVPQLLLADRSRALYPGDVALVEDVTGGSLETLLEQDPAAAERPMSVLAGWLAAFRQGRVSRRGRQAARDVVRAGQARPRADSAGRDREARPPRGGQPGPA